MSRFLCNCGFDQTAYSFCRQCGKELPEQAKRADSESRIQHDKTPSLVHVIVRRDMGANFCPHCGDNLRQVVDQQDVSQWVGSQLAVQQGQQIRAKEILLVLLLLDDSGSIKDSGNTQAVIDGYNGFVEALKTAPSEVRVKTMFLNNKRDIPFQHPKEVQLLTRQTYRPTEQTPLFLRSTQALDSIIKEAQDLVREGMTVRTMTFIFTDGGDNQSNGINASHVKIMADVMLTTGTHVIGGCAVNDGRTNFWQVFASMGIPEQWVKVLKNDASEIRESVADMGTMASTASTDYESFSQTNQTGFGPRDRGKK